MNAPMNKTTSIGKGQKIVERGGRDNSGDKSIKSARPSFGGGPTDVSHSLTGSSAVQTGVGSKRGK